MEEIENLKRLQEGSGSSCSGWIGFDHGIPRRIMNPDSCGLRDWRSSSDSRLGRLPMGTESELPFTKPFCQDTDLTLGHQAFHAHTHTHKLTQTLMPSSQSVSMEGT